MSADPPSVPRRRLLTLVVAHGLAAVTAVALAFLGVTWLASGGALAPRLVWLCAGFASAPIVAALAWSVVARWGDRVELWPDRLVRWERGRQEDFSLAAVVGFDARLGVMNAGMDLETRVGFRVLMQDGRVLAIDELPLRQAQPVLQLVGAVLLARWYAALRQGWSVVCADAPVFPWAPTGVVALFAAGAGVVFFYDGTGAVAMTVRAALVLVSVGPVMVRAVRAWWEARRTGGVEMSAGGIVPLSEVAAGRRPRLESAPYRAASDASQAWTPWSAVGDVFIDGNGLRVYCANRAEPLVLSGRTANFFVVNEFILAMRSARLQKGPARD